jgi:hypothetical protein
MHEPGPVRGLAEFLPHLRIVGPELASRRRLEGDDAVVRRREVQGVIDGQRARLKLARTRGELTG